MRVAAMFADVPMVAVAHRGAFVRVSAGHSVFVQIDLARRLAEHVLSAAVGAVHRVRFSVISVPTILAGIRTQIVRAGHVTSAITYRAGPLWFRHFLLSCYGQKNR